MKSRLFFYVKKYVTVIVGSILCAIAISMILDPNNLAPGGVTGISIMLNYLTKGTNFCVETGTWIFIINIPIAVLGIWKFGWKFFISTLISVITVSIASDIFSGMKPITNDLILASITGGALLGLGMGMVFRVGATTGGIDIIIRILKGYFPYMRVGSLFLIIDALIVFLSGFVFDNFDLVIYAAIAVAINTTIMDKVIYGGNGGKLAFIISDNQKVIMQRLLKELNVGATILRGEGAYKQSDRNIIMCAVRRQQLPQAVEIVSAEDEKAFMIVSSANEIFGEGFQGTNKI